jgi:RNA-directed DNA polymerase
MDLWPPHLYRRDGREVGRPDSVVSEALRQAHSLQSRGLPAILTLRHLAARTDTPHEQLRAYVTTTVDAYRTFRVRKRSGGFRRICVPEPSLMRVQRWLAKHLLNRIPPHPASAAYAPGASVIQCAQLHCGCRWMLKVDVRAFFESISEIQAYRVFQGLGYNELIAFEMARLCARRYGKSRRIHRHVWQAADKGYVIHEYANRQIGHLPQGAPTSPMLSNLALRGLDESVSAIAERSGFAFTRYADDLTFSGADRAITRNAVIQLLAEVNGALRGVGLIPNREKTVIAPPGARKLVLGLLVDRSTPRLQREFKARLLLHSHFLRKLGPAQHARTRGFRSVWSMHRHLAGLIAYASQVEPPFAARIQASLSIVDWGPFAPTPL